MNAYLWQDLCMRQSSDPDLASCAVCMDVLLCLQLVGAAQHVVLLVFCAWCEQLVNSKVAASRLCRQLNPGSGVS
jgi:hypothetical protein